MRELRRNEDINLNEIDARTDPNYDAATPELSDTAIESIKPAEYETVSNFETSSQGSGQWRSTLTPEFAPPSPWTSLVVMKCRK